MHSSSGLKRGLAGSAIAALAITGLPMLAAPAFADHGTPEVTLISQFNAGNDASARPDGTDSTVTLAAEVADPGNTVVFQYNLGNPNRWVTIDSTVANDDGYAIIQWNPNALTGANGDVTVSLRAQVVDNGTTFNSVRTGVTVVGSGDTTQETVNLDDDSQSGYFSQPYADSNQTAQNVIRTGTTSADDGNVALSWWRDSDDTFQGLTQAPVADDGTFRGVVDISGFDLTGAPDQIAFGAERDTDDVDASTLYRQTITTVDAATTGPAPAPGGSGDVTVTVTDQNNLPIAGAEVRRQPNGALVGYTDANGEVTDTRPSGSTTTYYANATDADGFNAGAGDRAGTVTVGEVEVTGLNGEIVLADGTVFDDDEYSDGDIYVQVRDDQGRVVANQTVRYRIQRTGDAAATTGTATTNAQGRAVIPFDTAIADGEYTLSYSFPPDRNGEPVGDTGSQVFQAGESRLVLTPDAEPDVAPAGGEIAYSGTLRLASGANLPGRVIDLDYARGTERAPGDGTPDAGIVDGNQIVLSKSVTTDGAGNFGFTIRDGAVTGDQQQGSEVGGVVTAATGDNVPGNGSTLDGNADETVSATTSFRAGGSVGEVTLNDPADGNAAGELVTYSATVTNTAGDPLAGSTVTFTTENGFFTADQRVDGREGVYTSAGQTTTAVTGADGVATVYLVIARDEGFDDDGEVTSTVTATTGAGSDSDEYTFDSGDPLNGSRVDIVRSPDALQETNNANGAQSGDDAVLFDVFTYDQFGNAVTDERVDLDASPGVVSSDFVRSDLLRDGDFSVTSGSDADVQAQVTATWEAGDATTDDINDTRDFTDSQAVSFYAIDYANSDYDLEYTGEQTQPVGSTVTFTYTAVDQFGEPIEDLFVDFFRSGPSGQQGDGNADGTTGQDGAISYTFQGSEAGDATVTAIGIRNRNGDNTGDVVEGSQESETITFAGPDGGDPEDVVVVLKGRNNGGEDDRLKARSTDEAAGATVRLVRIQDGRREVVKVKQLNENGDARFRAADLNGRKVTKYKVRLIGNDDVNSTTSNTRRIR